ncbi:hypothetical protein C8R47DRAFT_1189719 [Mycena vitilis]|nr:hypothetical protein C8R47DRAFT_1189719 [Mycena vitilis]
MANQQPLHFPYASVQEILTATVFACAGFRCPRLNADTANGERDHNPLWLGSGGTAPACIDRMRSVLTESAGYPFDSRKLSFFPWVVVISFQPFVSAKSRTLQDRGDSSVRAYWWAPVSLRIRISQADFLRFRLKTVGLHTHALFSDIAFDLGSNRRIIALCNVFSVLGGLGRTAVRRTRNPVAVSLRTNSTLNSPNIRSRAFEPREDSLYGHPMLIDFQPIVILSKLLSTTPSQFWWKLIRVSILVHISSIAVGPHLYSFIAWWNLSAGTPARLGTGPHAEEPGSFLPLNVSLKRRFHVPLVASVSSTQATTCCAYPSQDRLNGCGISSA